MSGKGDWPREKRWKDVYTRSAKLARAQKIGFEITSAHRMSSADTLRAPRPEPNGTSSSFERKPLHVLDIPDDYKYMDPELVELLEQSVAGVLGLP